MSVAPAASDTLVVPAPSNRARWAGRVLTAIAILFLAFDVVGKLVAPKAVVEGTTKLGYQPHHILVIGLLGLVCLILFVVPRTAPLGAVLWTGYLGGAVATQLRVDAPLLGYVLSPVYVAAVVWGGLWLRDARVRAMLAPTPPR